MTDFLLVMWVSTLIELRLDVRAGEALDSR